jgi:hypothetical protein
MGVETEAGRWAWRRRQPNHSLRCAGRRIAQDTSGAAHPEAQHRSLLEHATDARSSGGMSPGTHRAQVQRSSTTNRLPTGSAAHERLDCPEADGGPSRRAMLPHPSLA